MIEIEQIDRLNIDIDRVQADLEDLSRIGRAEDRSIYRMAFTQADMEARKWLMQRLEQAGLQTEIDGAANVFGRFCDGTDKPVTLIGSHLDTVPAGGSLDGALGVVLGLECLRRIKEEGLQDDIQPVELVAFSDEEGRFGGGFFGSRALVGDLNPAVIHEAMDLHGVLLSDAMTNVGLDPMAALNARRAPGSYRAYLELHIEQGPVLDAEKTPIGLVEAITGIFRWQVRLLGQADHAGTTPMPMRHDALAGLAEFTGEIPRILEENGSDSSVATIGNVQLFPGNVNTVPGQAEFSLDVRDADREVLDQLGDTMRRALSAIGRRRGLMFEFDMLSDVDPVPCDTRVIDTIADSLDSSETSHRRMMSGAGHDAQKMAAIAPVGMLFVPSKDGRSHTAAEWTHMEDIRTGGNTLLRSALRLARLETSW
jgi:N-carbamoyl-L-amino-acid hydrolase